jgi:hypothetical protein
MTAFIAENWSAILGVGVAAMVAFTTGVLVGMQVNK